MDKKMIAPGVWNVVPNGMAAAYLVVGEKKALLIDSGAGEVDVKAVCAEITELPIDLVNTHYHDDHTAANKEFDNVHMHPADIRKLTEWKQITPVTEGYVFDLGGRSLEVIEIPGHTPGGIALYDREANIMFTGDTVGRAPVFLVEGDYDLDAFEASLRKLMGYGADMYGAHDMELNRVDTLKKQLEAMALYRAGQIEPQEVSAPMKATVYVAPNGTGFFCPQK
ncbi:MAG: MBL fold metallo-hydrolase [Clostridiales bacterium]|nr:MBL fold metallo-hydrolase [Clostridiales bacterium]